MALPLLIVPQLLDWIMLGAGFVSFIALVYLLYIIIVAPALTLKAERDAPPPRPGYIYELLIEDQERHQHITIGQLDATIKTRLNGIREEQLRLEFHKDRGLEEYEIMVIPGANLFYRRPHTKKLEIQKERDEFAGRELIGNPALFRLAASVQGNRPTQYVEFELRTDYIINQIGEEKMKFFLELTRIYPGIDENSRNKKGVFNFGRPQKTEVEES
ncbi:MAG: hypothetical protein KDK39_08190 [Leptospiraceae bacterium]|nr:hypothetical protein [Leptospiraceae bacterium]